MIGPFSTNPFTSEIAISPLNSVPKSTSNERRVILDLSWPVGTSVNDGISPDTYLGEEIHLTYPSIDNIAEHIVKHGPGCHTFKRDLKRAYRQFPVDPRDYNLLGYKWNNELYFDVVLPMGLRMAAMACQRITSAVSHICRTAGYDVLNYLDDFIGISRPSTANDGFEICGHLLSSLGLEESTDKAVSPSTNATCLVIHFDTVHMTMSVTHERLQELDSLLDQWLNKRSTTRRQLQSLIGKLCFVTNV